MRVLVTGAAGQLGVELAEVCRQAGAVVIAADRRHLDVGDRDAVLGAVSTERPDVVINTAAWTAVDACQGDLERAFRDNALAVRWLRDATSRIGAHLVQLSTDYVFDGTLDRPYVEWDATNPTSIYGASKLGGEAEAGPDATVVRTSWVFGAGGNNIVKTVLRLASEGTPMRFVDDQRGCPTSAADLALAVRRIAVARQPGLFHVTNSGPVTWYDFVREILSITGCDPDLVEPISTAELDPPRPAPRPANSVLDNVAMRLAGFATLRHHHEPLREVIDQLTG